MSCSRCQSASILTYSYLQLGPFVDASHPMLKTGDVDLTPTQIFASQVSKKINSFLDYSSGSTVILVPSVRDLISYNVVYPQAPFDKEGLGLHKVGHHSIRSPPVAYNT